MSTTFTLHRTKDETLFAAPDKVVELTERSARFDLDLDGYADVGVHEVEGPQQMSAEEAMQMAAGILYAVSCSYPDEVEKFVVEMDGWGLVDTWNAICKARQNVTPN